jgi:hypothetical protein
MASTALEEQKSLIHRNDEINWTTVKVPCCGLRHYSGISSRYSTQFPPKLAGLLSKTEFTTIIERLNETIMDYWPCDLCYYLGYGCCPCTLGLSVLIPNYCTSYSELYATAYLRNVSLKAVYYDRQISFTLVKNICSSYVEVKFPTKLLDDEASHLPTDGFQFPDMENGQDGTNNDSNLANLIITSVPSAFASTAPERLKKS